MGLSTVLLVVAVLAAALPLVSTWLRPPQSFREVEKSFVVGVATLVIGTLVASRLFTLGIFGLFHLAYLLMVITLPLLLGGWYVLAVLRRRRTLMVRLGGFAAIGIAGIGIWATHIEPNWLTTDVVTVRAAVTRPVRIGVLSDLQTPNIGKHEQNAINTLIAEQPDIVLVPGDLFEGAHEVITAAAPDFIELLTTLRENVGIVALVSGDSDTSAQLPRIAAAAEVLLVDDEIVDLDVGGQAIRLAGLSTSSHPKRLDVIAALATPSDAFTVLLSHRPDVVFELPLATDVDLIVAGHTHGGQVAIPFIGPIVTLSDVPRSVAAGGLGVVDNYPIYVSTGVGLERGPAPQVRFGVRPSVGVINVIPTA